MWELNPCPFCGGTKNTHIEATGGEWVGLVTPICGRVKPIVCLDCGLVYVDKNQCERIKKRREYNGKK